MERQLLDTPASPHPPQTVPRRRARPRWPVAVLAGLACMGTGAGLVASAPAASAAPTTFVVSKTTDGGPGSLRQAITDANAHPGADTIELAPGVYTLSIQGINEDANATGDLDIAGDLTIEGSGAPAVTTVDGSNIDRVFDHHTGTFTLRHLTVSHGSPEPTAAGGGLRSTGFAMVDDAVFLLNSALVGAGVSSSGPNLWLNRSEVVFNAAPLLNYATGIGGGIALTGGPQSNLSVTESVVAYNDARDGDGGGIFSSGPTQIDATTVTNNNAYAAGGVLLDSVASPYISGLTSDTIADNTSSTTATGSGIVLRRNAKAHVAATILQGNTAGGLHVNCQVAPLAALTSVGANLSSDGTCPKGPTDRANNGAIALGALGDHGGWTMTRLPAAGSSAIDTADCGAVTDQDQRGFPRPGTACDVGAAEVESTRGSGFHGLTPTRILDSRTPTGGWNAPLVAGTPKELVVAGAKGVPAGAVAVVMNVTVTNGTAGSFLTTYPKGQPAPVASNINFAAGQTIPNLVTVPVGQGGRVMIANAVGTVDVVADLVGYYDAPGTTGDSFVGVTPARVLDSRTAIGGWASTKIGPGVANVRTLKVAGAGGVSGAATAVVLNVTVTNPDTASFLRVYPTGAGAPVTSNLNFAAGQTIPNLVTVAVGTNGQVSFFNALGHTDVVADVVGYYVGGLPDAGRFHPVRPTRVLDDRVKIGAATAWGPGEDRAVSVRSVSPAARQVVMNTTATNPTKASFLTVHAAQTPVPVTSNVNFGPGQTIANLAITEVGDFSRIAVANQAGTVDVIGDVVGYFAFA